MTENPFGDAEFDPGELHREFQREAYDPPPISRQSFWLNAALEKLDYRRKLVNAGLIDDWFQEFRIYWQECLGFEDSIYFGHFWWLLGEATNRMYESFPIGQETSELRDQEKVDIWRQPEMIGGVLRWVYRYACYPLTKFYPLRASGLGSMLRKHLTVYRRLKAADRVLEYGCGIAPATYGALKYGGYDAEFTISDLRTFPYHFAKWRFANRPSVSYRDIVNGQSPEYDHKFDAIYLLEVLEHIPQPLTLVEQLTASLNPDGYLIVDFVQTDGGYLDAHGAAEKRDDTLRYITENYSIVAGDLAYLDSENRPIVAQLN